MRLQLALDAVGMELTPRTLNEVLEFIGNKGFNFRIGEGGSGLL